MAGCLHLSQLPCKYLLYLPSLSTGSIVNQENNACAVCGNTQLNYQAKLLFTPIVLIRHGYVDPTDPQKCVPKNL